MPPPIATKIAASGRLEREFSIPIPLRERNDWYYAPAPIEDYAISRADRIAFSLQYLRSTVAGFHAEQVHYAPEFFVVGGSATVKQAESLNLEFSIEPTQFFTRKDVFMRL